LTVVDPSNNTILNEMGSENLIEEIHDVWVATGAGVLVTQEDKNIFYGSSGIKINTTSADTGAYQDISNSALLYKDNAYTCTLRLRSITGSTSARVTFRCGASANSITAVFDTDNWWPFVVRNTLAGDTLTARVDVTTMNFQNNEGALLHLDGLQVIEGDYPSTFISHGRVRKSGEVGWPVTD
jgi:hypothetical protein